MEFFVQQLVNGVTLGSVYALIALGYSMVYGILKLLNFAHGEVYMMGAFIGYFVLIGLGGAASPIVPVALVIILMFLAGMLGAGILGVVIERFAYRPLRNAPRIAPLISAIGVSFFLQASALLLFTAQFRTYNTPELIPFSVGIDVGPLRISLVRILVIVSAIALMIALWLLVNRTRLGKAMRATSYDREAAAMMGIDVDRVIGGIGNIPGAMLGGLLIGLAEAFSAAYISSTFQNLIVFGILITVMLVRPSGLLGSPVLTKV